VSHQPSEEQQQSLSIQKRLQNLTNDEIKIKNRVGLLENEQKRILKKVEETRVRAAKIKSIKEANEQSFLEKMHRKSQQESEARNK